jgi:hypothetical protein
MTMMYLAMRSLDRQMDRNMSKFTTIDNGDNSKETEEDEDDENNNDDEDVEDDNEPYMTMHGENIDQGLKSCLVLWSVVLTSGTDSASALLMNEMGPPAQRKHSISSVSETSKVDAVPEVSTTPILELEAPRKGMF